MLVLGPEHAPERFGKVLTIQRPKHETEAMARQGRAEDSRSHPGMRGDELLRNVA